MKLVATESGSEALAERIDAYLDGLLTPAETRATERMLADPAVAALLAEALALREVLASGADAPTPPDLAERIIANLGLGDERAPTGEGSVGQAALYGASWMVRGAGVSGGAHAVGTVRYALGPLALLGAANEEPVVEKPRKWWSLRLRRTK